VFKYILGFVGYISKKYLCFSPKHLVLQSAYLIELVNREEGTMGVPCGNLSHLEHFILQSGISQLRHLIPNNRIETVYKSIN